MLGDSWQQLQVRLTKENIVSVPFLSNRPTAAAPSFQESIKGRYNKNLKETRCFDQAALWKEEDCCVAVHHCPISICTFQASFIDYCGHRSRPEWQFTGSRTYTAVQWRRFRCCKVWDVKGRNLKEPNVVEECQGGNLAVHRILCPRPCLVNE